MLVWNDMWSAPAGPRPLGLGNLGADAGYRWISGRWKNSVGSRSFSKVPNVTYRPVNAQIVGLKDAISRVKSDGWVFKYAPIKLTDIYHYGLFVTEPTGQDYDVGMESRVEIKTFNRVQSLVNFHFENVPNAQDVTIPVLPDHFEISRK